MIRATLAILAGIAVLVLSVVSFAIEAALPPATTLPMQAFTTLYTLAAIAAGGYVAARIATPRAALIMGIIQLAMTIAVLFTMTLNHPLWLTIAGATLIVPAAWLGGRLQRSNPARS